MIPEKVYADDGCLWGPNIRPGTQVYISCFQKTGKVTACTVMRKRSLVSVEGVNYPIDVYHSDFNTGFIEIIAGIRRKFKIKNNELIHRLWMAGIEAPEKLVFEEDVNLDDDFKLGHYVVDVDIDGQVYQTLMAYEDLQEITEESELPPVPKLDERFERFSEDVKKPTVACKHSKKKYIPMIFNNIVICEDCGKDLGTEGLR